jgi:membrane protein CcdC involved in cytochrome C biogenesis
MSFLPDELKTQTFPCPNCHQYISSEVNACKFCSFAISLDVKQISIDKEKNEKKNIYLKRHRNTLIVGIGLLIIGLYDVFFPIFSLGFSFKQYSNVVKVSCLSPILIILGFCIIIYSLVGYIREK